MQDSSTLEIRENLSTGKSQASRPYLFICFTHSGSTARKCLMAPCKPFFAASTTSPPLQLQRHAALRARHPLASSALPVVTSPGILPRPRHFTPLELSGPEAQALVVPGSAVRPMLQQQIHDGTVVVAGSQVQGSLASCNSRHLGPTIACGSSLSPLRQTSWPRAGFALGLDVCLSLQQQLHNGAMAVQGREMQRGPICRFVGEAPV